MLMDLNGMKKAQAATYDPKIKFDQKIIQIDDKTAVYKLKYFESGLYKHVEDLLDEEVYVGETIRVKR
jgi:hypothetical protein